MGNNLEQINRQDIMNNRLRRALINEEYSYMLGLLGLFERGGASDPLKEQTAQIVTEYIRAYTRQEYDICWQYVLNKLGQREYWSIGE